MVFCTLSLFCDLLTCSGKCWLIGKSDHVAAELTVQQSKCLALLLGGLWVPRIPRGCEGYEVTKFCKSYGAALRNGSSAELHESCARTVRRFTGPRIALSDCTVWARSAPTAPRRPDRGPTQSGPVNCTKLASPSFAIDTVAIRILRKTGVELKYAPSGPDRAPIAPSGPDRAPIGRSGNRAPIAPSGPDRVPIAPSGPDSVGPRQLYQAGIA